MTYAIFDAGNLVSSFDREDEAREALEHLVGVSAGARQGLLGVAFDDGGNVTADWAPGARNVTAP